jgi:hypothetical protein
MAEDSPNRECPYCKENIHPEAMKCRHCGTMLVPTVRWEVRREGGATGAPLVSDGPGASASTARFGSSPGLGGGPLAVLIGSSVCFEVPIEECVPDTLVFGHVTIPIQLCRTVWVWVCL